nr:LRRN4 C-terminal-like protein isoform X3 [Misgurnus anguillicaudatus]
MLPGSWVAFLLLLLLSEAISAISVLQPPVKRVAVEYDYDELNSVTTVAPGSTITTAIPIRCDYDTCVPQTTSCAEISFKTGCLCPGFTVWDKRPEAPWLREIILERSGQVVVHWCAPHSKVTHYKVTLKCGDEQQQIFGEHLRNATVPGLKVGETVCVSAVNEAGVSEESCAQYELQELDLKRFMVILTLLCVSGSTTYLSLLKELMCCCRPPSPPQSPIVVTMTPVCLRRPPAMRFRSRRAASVRGSQAGIKGLRPRGFVRSNWNSRDRWSSTGVPLTPKSHIIK